MAIDLNIDFDEQFERLAGIRKPIRLAIALALLVSLATGYWFFSYQRSTNIGCWCQSDG